ncbi:nitrous oxide reductase accessory protein NosL [Sulfurimonas sp.]
MKKLIGLILLGLITLGYGAGEELVQEGEHKTECVRCGMDLVRFYKTSHAAEHEGKKFQYCSIHCLEEHLGEGISLKNPKVVDNTTLKLISIAKAFYVVGSNKRGTMSRISKYAFSNLEDAKIFQSKFGGEIMDFNGAREVAKKDFKHYR